MQRKRVEHSHTRRLFFRLLIIVSAVIFGAGLWITLGRPSRQASWNEKPLEGLSVYGETPDFSLLERNGRRVGLPELRGKVWVANFIYTSCKDTCPLQSAEMARLQRDFVEQMHVRLVSISVDPVRDTPEVLSRYAERYKADPDRWLFLTGKKDNIRRLAQEGFHLIAVQPGEDGHNNTIGPILHSSRFVLVDRQARVRGYYDSSDGAALQRLRRDVRELIQGNT